MTRTHTRKCHCVWCGMHTLYYTAVVCCLTVIESGSRLYEVSNSCWHSLPFDVMHFANVARSQHGKQHFGSDWQHWAEQEGSRGELDKKSCVGGWGEEGKYEGKRWLAQLAAIVLWCFCVIVAVFLILHNSSGKGARGDKAIMHDYMHVFVFVHADTCVHTCVCVCVCPCACICLLLPYHV